MKYFSNCSYVSDLAESPGIIDEVDSANNNFLRPAPVRNVSRKKPALFPPDAELEKWLIDNGFWPSVRAAIHAEDFTFHDLMYEADQEDLRRMNLT